MMSLRAVRVTGIINQFLGPSHSGPSATYAKIMKPSQRHYIAASIARCATGGVPTRRLDRLSPYDRQLSKTAPATVVMVLNDRRHFSGHSGKPGDKRSEGSTEKRGDTKKTYTFLDREDHGHLAGQSAKRDPSTGKSAAGFGEDGEDVDFKNMTMWQRVKYVRSTAKLLWKRYGLVAIGTSLVLYVGGFGVVYILLATGLVDPNVDTSDVMQRLADFTGASSNDRLAEYVKHMQHLVRTHKDYEHLFMAFVVNEALELPRDVVVLLITPRIARALGRAPSRDTKETKETR